MSVRWRADGTLVCGAKSAPLEGDSYVDDRLHYELAEIQRVLIPHDDEAETGLWRWRREYPECGTFALAHPARPADVVIWAEPREEVGGGYFYCLNGGWSGWFDGAHVRLDCGDPGDPIPAVEVWRGVVPRGMEDYNEALEWIQEQVCPTGT